MAGLLHQPKQPLTIPTGSSVSSLGPPKLFKPSSLKPQELGKLPSIEELGISLGQCNKSIGALITYINKREGEGNNLLEEAEEKVYLVIGLKRAAIREQHKPIQLYVSLLLFYRDH
jgi:hypothetical protein